MAPAIRRILAAAVVMVTACGCSGSSSTSPSTTGSTLPAGALPRVDLILPAVSALETKLGAPQQFFEINATPQLVNLFVALNGGKVVQPWVYLDGVLSSSDVSDANGYTFVKSALDFDPDKVFTHIEAELPQSRPDAFVIEAGVGGIVRYTVRITSPQGGQMAAIVGPDGAVKSAAP